MKRLIDINTLFCLLSSCASQTLFLRTGEIDQLELRYGHIDRVSQILRLDRQTENAVGTRTKIVEIMAGKDAVTSTVFVQIQDFLGCSRFKNIEVLHDKLVFLGPADSQTCLAFDRVASLAGPLHDLRIQ